MPLYFSKFVTDRRFLEIVTLSDFYKSWISGNCAIRLFHRQGTIRSCDIKYLASAKEKAVISEEKSGRSEVYPLSRTQEILVAQIFRQL